MLQKTPEPENEEHANKISIGMCARCGEMQITLHLAEGKRVTAGMEHMNVIDFVLKVTHLCSLYAENRLTADYTDLPIACGCEGRARPN